MKKSSFQKPLSKTRAQEILNAYGADPERWPEDERQSLIQLLAQSPELQALRETGALLDGLLDEWQPKLTCSTDTLISSLPAQPRRKQNWPDQLAAFFFPGLYGLATSHTCRDTPDAGIYLGSLGRATRR